MTVVRTLRVMPTRYCRRRLREEGIHVRVPSYEPCAYGGRDWLVDLAALVTGIAAIVGLFGMKYVEAGIGVGVFFVFGMSTWRRNYYFFKREMEKRDGGTAQMGSQEVE